MKTEYEKEELVATLTKTIVNLIDTKIRVASMHTYFININTAAEEAALRVALEDILIEEDN